MLFDMCINILQDNDFLGKKNMAVESKMYNFPCKIILGYAHLILKSQVLVTHEKEDDVIAYSDFLALKENW